MGSANGRYRTGRFTKEAKADLKLMRELVRLARAELSEL
jgi:hypothetical protein